MDQSVRRYPFDVDEIEKGTRIPPDEIETIYGVDRNLREYDLAALKHADAIEKSLADVGRPATVAVKKLWVCVLTDQEAAEYTKKACKSRMKSFNKNLRRAAVVDMSQLEDAQRKDHERTILVNSAIAAAARAAKRKALSDQRVQRAIENKRE